MKKEKSKMSVNVKTAFQAALCAAAFLLAGCGGGFGADSREADDLGPPIFGKDSTGR